MPPEEDIRKTIAQFANSIDLKDWALMESSLAEVLTVDHSDLRGDPPEEISAGEFVRARRDALEKLDTQHIIGNLAMGYRSDQADGALERR